MLDDIAHEAVQLNLADSGKGMFERTAEGRGE